MLRQFNSEYVKGNDDGGSSCYLGVSFSKKVMHPLVLNINLNLLTDYLAVISFSRIFFVESIKRC